MSHTKQASHFSLFSPQTLHIVNKSREPSPSSMGKKMWVEVCLISARGLRRTSALWKLQWYAVGWIDPSNKYCTKIDASGNANPVWRTKFASLVEKESSSAQELALRVEVYSRDPVFLRERLQGTATVVLREFLAKHGRKSSESGDEDVGSYQLRKRSSNKPQGFVDVSIRISEEREEPSSYAGDEGGIVLMDQSINVINSTTKPQPHWPENQVNTNYPYNHPRPMPFPSNYPYNPSSAAGPSYRPAQTQTPPPPPPPSHVGYIPTFLPQSYINMPPSGAGGGGRGGFGAGLGVGALAAGAVIFGDDFMSGFSVPAGLQDASLTITTDPPF